MSSYVYATARERERECLDAVEAAFDITSRALLERLGLPAGSTCVEVGAGGGSMACWLADRVGPAGRVVATDIDLTWLERLGRDDIQLRNHDIATDDLEAEATSVRKPF
jgi:tRNA A58 N-methylase Trm61